jgi:hypothetical protein
MFCALHIYYCCVRHITTAFCAGSRSLYHKGCVMHVQVTFLSLFSNVGQRHSNVFVFGVILFYFTMFSTAFVNDSGRVTDNEELRRM